MKLTNIFMIFLSLIIFTGIVFSGTPPMPPVSDQLFTVTITLPNPYHGIIVSDFANVANPNSVNNASVQNYAISNLKIANNAITTEKIEDGAVTSNKINANVINNSHLQDDSVSSAKIQNYAITQGKLGLNAVDTENINYEAVATDNIKTGAVIDKKLADYAVTNPKIANNAVSVNKLDILTPAGKCPIDGANLTYNATLNKLEWSQTATCGVTSNLTSATIGAVNNSEYYASPFGSCIKNISHTINGIVCKGNAGVDACILQVSLYEAGTSNLKRTTAFYIPANTSGTPTSVTFTTQSQYFNYDLNAELTQGSSGLYSTIKRSNNSAISKSGCSPIINTLNYSATTDSDYCVSEFQVNASATCIDRCNYQISVDGTPYYNTTGTIIGSGNLSIPINPHFVPAAGADVTFTVTNFYPSGISGLVTTQSNTITYPLPSPGADCLYPRS